MNFRWDIVFYKVEYIICIINWGMLIFKHTNLAITQLFLLRLFFSYIRRPLLLIVHEKGSWMYGEIRNVRLRRGPQCTAGSAMYGRVRNVRRGPECTAGSGMYGRVRNVRQGPQCTAGSGMYVGSGMYGRAMYGGDNLLHIVILWQSCA